MPLFTLEQVVEKYECFQLLIRICILGVLLLLFMAGIVCLLLVNSVAQMVGAIALGGIVLLLMAGQFSKTWDLFVN